MPAITIKNWSDGTAIYSVEAVDLREAIQLAVRDGVSLAQAELVFVNMSRANLYRADLRGANLSGASLRNACLYGVKLREADLRGDAALDGVDLGLADLREALGIDRGPGK